MTLSNETLKDLYYYLILARLFDEEICDLYKEGRLPEKPLSGIGEEATAIGASYALDKNDYIMPSLRTRGAFLVKGLSVEEILIEMYRKERSRSRGRWTAHHMGDLEKGILLGSGVIGSSVLIATGAALASKIKKSKQVSMVFFGDGASSRGDIHVAMNFASVMDLPIVFICENNRWALSTPINKQMKNENIADRAVGYGMIGEQVDGQNLLNVYNASKEAVSRARMGKGPTLIECKTYHFRGHSESHDPDDGRPNDELVFWRNKCPIRIYREYLEKETKISLEDLNSIDENIKKLIRQSVNKVEKMSDIDPSKENIEEYVYL